MNIYNDQWFGYILQMLFIKPFYSFSDGTTFTIVRLVIKHNCVFKIAIRRMMIISSSNASFVREMSFVTSEWTVDVHP